MSRSPLSGRTEPTFAATLEGSIASRRATVAVVGLGYVGLPVLSTFHAAGFPVLGIDRDAEKIAAIDRGENYLAHLGTDLTLRLAGSSRYHGTADPTRIAEADAVLLCLPTPLGPNRVPDLGYLEGSVRALAPHLRPGTLILVTSTSYPGTTREIVAPLLAAAGWEPGVDVFIAFSPEREDPGRRDLPTAQIPRLVGGLDPFSGDLAEALLAAAFADVHRVASAEVAEAAKILENVYRAVNIALVNEMKPILERLDLDIWEVIDAAATKPFGFQRFDPGPGLGGHCIPIDPFYFAHRARQAGAECRLIELAGEINTAMPGQVVARVVRLLSEEGIAVAGARVLVLGIAYKRDVADVRETPAAEIIEGLAAAGLEVAYHDPHIPRFPRMRRHALDLDSIPLTPQALAASDVVLVVTDHSAIDWPLVGMHALRIVDTRNALARVPVRGRWVKA